MESNEQSGWRLAVGSSLGRLSAPAYTCSVMRNQRYERNKTGAKEHKVGPAPFNGESENDYKGDQPNDTDDLDTSHVAHPSQKNNKPAAAPVPPVNAIAAPTSRRTPIPAVAAPAITVAVEHLSRCVLSM